MESERKGKESTGAHSVTPGAISGASRVVCWVRAASSKCRAGPHAPTCSSSKPNTSSRARGASAASSRSTRAPSGASNQEEDSRDTSNQGSFLKILANFKCYRLNTPQNVYSRHAHQRAPGARILGQLHLAHRLASRARPRGCGRPGRCRARHRRVAAQRSQLSRHSTDPPPPRSYRRGSGTVAPMAGTRGRPRRQPNCAAHTDRPRRRTLRLAGLGTLLRDFASARAYFKPHCPLGAWGAVLRRHAVQRWLRPDVRGYAYTNERIVDPLAELAAGHPGVLRPRIYRGEPAFRIDGGARQHSRARVPSPRGPRAREGRALAALDHGIGNPSQSLS